MTLTTTPVFTKNDFRTLARFLKVAHHIPGRIRLKIRQGIQHQFPNMPKLTLDDLHTLLSGIESISDIRINKYIGSVTIQYDPNRTPPSDWDHYLQSGDATTLLADLVIPD